jgi:uncharacterized protein (UPF0333 family)
MAISNGEGESKIENSGSNKEKLAEYLHNKSPLSSLRTYHGDMAEFIKEKNESVISIATKEKERRDEKRSKEEKLGTVMPTQRKKQSKDGFQINFTILLSSLVLIAGGAVTFFYVFDAVIRAPQGKVEIKEEIIPYNNSVTLANTTPSSLGSELSKLPPSNGISIIKISDTNGKTVGNAKDFFNFMKIAPPATLWRTMGSKYAIGITYNDDSPSPFLVISVSDFGLAFSSMLEWEKGMPSDLAFLIPTKTDDAIATSSQNAFLWKDLVVKNKDTRVFINSKNEIKMAYSFLDKNTILITDNPSTISNMSEAYIGRSFTR